MTFELLQRGGWLHGAGGGMPWWERGCACKKVRKEGEPDWGGGWAGVLG